jgi:uncharacterized membrane protein YkvA (DUF1232 family)
MQLMLSIKSWARRMKRTSVALSFAYRHTETPLLAKLVCMLIVAYALSPIDLIPEFIPVLGFLDELLLLERTRVVQHAVGGLPRRHHQ